MERSVVGVLRTSSSAPVCLSSANLCEATRDDYLRYLDLLDSQVPIVHIHLHENWGDFDTHLPIFTGPSAANPAGMEGFVTRTLRV